MPRPDIARQRLINQGLVKPALKGWYDNVMNTVYSQDLEIIAPTRGSTCLK